MFIVYFICCLTVIIVILFLFFFFPTEDRIPGVTWVQTCALPVLVRQPKSLGRQQREDRKPETPGGPKWAPVKKPECGV